MRRPWDVAKTTSGSMSSSLAMLMGRALVRKAYEQGIGKPTDRFQCPSMASVESMIVPSICSRSAHSARRQPARLEGQAFLGCFFRW